MRSDLCVTAAICSALILSTCARTPETPPDPSVTNQVLGIRLASLPSDFQVSLNEGEHLELVPVESSVEGRVTFSVGQRETGINLVAAVKGHQRRVEERPEADYRGGQELVTPLGTAFYSRGRFLTGLTESEETAIFVKHPSESRLLTIAYRYPAGADSSVRVQQLLDILGELEGVSEPGATAAPGAGGE
jgi:hypothetical protein